MSAIISSTLSFLNDGDYILIHDGRTLVVPDATWIHGPLNRTRLDERYPFNYWEACYHPGDGYVYIPQGAALGAKLLTLHYVLGPLRLEMGISFDIPSGGGYDPVTNGQGKRVTHRVNLGKNEFPADSVRLSRSQHGYQPDRLVTSASKGGRPTYWPTGTAWDFRPKGLDKKMRDEIVVWLWKAPFGHLESTEVRSAGLKDRSVSYGLYGPEHGNFIHIDMRPGKRCVWKVGIE